VRAVVTGGTGFVGSHLVDALLERGDTVTAVVRDVSRAGRLAEQGAQVVPAELDDAGALARSVDGADLVFHVAGVIKAIDQREYFRVNAEGTGRLLDACRQAEKGPRRFVLVSSQAAGGPGWRERPRTEDDEPRPVSPYGRSKLEAERIALAASGDVEVAIVRPCVVYGPRDRAVLPLFKAMRWGLAPRLPNNPPVSLIHVRDLTDCLIRAADAPAAAGRAYFACGPAAGIDQLVGMIAAGLGKRPVSVPVPSVALVAAGIGADVLSRLTRRPRPFGRQKALEMLHTSWWCSGDRAERELGFRARIAHADGLAETTRWYQARGWI
jgi:nucleoside-diphosphate-sugar epimerase